MNRKKIFAICFYSLFWPVQEKRFGCCVEQIIMHGCGKPKLRSNSLRSTERKLLYPSISVNNRTNKKYGRIRKRIQIIMSV